MLTVEVQPSKTVDRDPEQQHHRHQRVAGDEPGESGDSREANEGDTNAVEGAKHPAEPTGLTGPRV